MVSITQLGSYTAQTPDTWIISESCIKETSFPQYRQVQPPRGEWPQVDVEFIPVLITSECSFRRRHCHPALTSSFPSFLSFFYFHFLLRNILTAKLKSWPFFNLDFSAPPHSFISSVVSFYFLDYSTVQKSILSHCCREENRCAKKKGISQFLKYILNKYVVEIQFKIQIGKKKKKRVYSLK